MIEFQCIFVRYCLCKMTVGVNLRSLVIFIYLFLSFQNLSTDENRKQQQGKKKNTQLNQNIKMKLAIERFGRFTSWQGYLVCLLFLFRTF